jgi:hypothetical protein
MIIIRVKFPLASHGHGSSLSQTRTMSPSDAGLLHCYSARPDSDGVTVTWPGWEQCLLVF